MICNPTGTHSVRMRPNLAVTSAEIHTSLQIINSSLNQDFSKKIIKIKKVYDRKKVQNDR